MSEQMKPGIYVEIKPALSDLDFPGLRGGVFGKKHAYLIYRKPDGTEEVIRGGFDFDENDGAIVSVQTGVSLGDSKDAYKPDEKPGSRLSRRLNIDAEKQQEVWRRMHQQAERIGKAKIPYRFDFEPEDPDQTSNAVVRSILHSEKLSLEEALPEGVNPDDLPGIKDDLTDELQKSDSLWEKAKGESYQGRDPKQESERQQLIDDLTHQDDPLSEIVQKKPADWTEDEVGLVMRAKGKARTDDEKQKLHTLAQDFFKSKYGTGEARRDETGRLLDPTPIAPINRKPVPVSGPDGKPVGDTVTALAKRLSETVGRDGRAETVKSLQGGLNILLDARTGKDMPPFRPLKTDGLAGPKTRSAFKTAARDLGPEKVKEGVALGRFNRFADTVARGKPSGEVKTEAETAFGGLFRDPSRGNARKSTEEGLSLQATLNDLGTRKLGNGFTPLKEDGDIGPKTTDAFRQVLPAVGAKDFTRRLGGNLGFLDDQEDRFTSFG